MKEPPSRRAQMRKKEAAASRSEFWSCRLISLFGGRFGQSPAVLLDNGVGSPKPAESLH